MVKSRLKCYTAIIISGITSIVLVVVAEIMAFYVHAPSGPGQAKGLEGRYYNFIYALSACPSDQLEEYENENVRFLHFNCKSVNPSMERNGGTGKNNRILAETMLKYTAIPSSSFGNTYVTVYKPQKVAPATVSLLKDFVGKYAAEAVGVNPEIKYGYVPGAPFSAYFSSGSREGICFTDSRHNLYCFNDPDMAMQRGDIPFMPRLIDSLGLWSYPVDDYAHGGVKSWFAIPYYEKRSECNFTEIKRTLRVKRWRK